MGDSNLTSQCAVSQSTRPSVTCRNTYFRAILFLPLEAIDCDRRANSHCDRGISSEVIHVAVCRTEVRSKRGSHQ